MKTNKRYNKLSIRPVDAPFATYHNNHEAIRLPPIKIAIKNVDTKNITRNHHQKCEECKLPKLYKTKFFDTCTNFNVRKTLFAEFNRMESNELNAYSNGHSLIDGFDRRPETRSTSESPSKGGVDTRCVVQPTCNAHGGLHEPVTEWMLCQDDSID